MTTPKIPTAATLRKATADTQKRREANLAEYDQQIADRKKRDIAAHRAEAIKIIERYIALQIEYAIKYEGHSSTRVWSLYWGLKNGQPALVPGSSGGALSDNKHMTVHVVRAALEVVKARLAKKGLTANFTANPLMGGGDETNVIIDGNVKW